MKNLQSCSQLSLTQLPQLSSTHSFMSLYFRDIYMDYNFKYQFFTSILFCLPFLRVAIYSCVGILSAFYDYHLLLGSFLLCFLIPSSFIPILHIHLNTLHLLPHRQHSVILKIIFVPLINFFLVFCQPLCNCLFLFRMLNF